VERDEELRNSCFLSLAVLSATFGSDIPYRDGLDAGFPFRGKRVPFLSTQKGIFRAAAQRGPAALSVQTSTNSRYDDAALESGFRYAYRAGSPNQADNRALQTACLLAVPIVYFVATRPGRYAPIYPSYIVEDHPETSSVVLAPGRLIGPLDEREPALIEDPIERRYAVRETRVRLHERPFRGQVLLAYRDSCAICRLKEAELLDAAHIAADASPSGEPRISNGLSLCSIHHRAFDQNLVGVSPDYLVHVSSRLLDDEDGPMLALLKTFHKEPIVLPHRSAWRPDREQLGERFERFRDV
jgi:putative restriction endonuclease